MPAVERVVVALPPGVPAPDGTIGVVGGAERSHSVAAALAAAGEADVVLVHDAARPLVEPDLVARCLAGLDDAARPADAVIAAAPMSDTVKEAGDDHRVVRTLDRARLWAVQTPQVFRRAALERALASRRRRAGGGDRRRVARRGRRGRGARRPRAAGEPQGDDARRPARGRPAAAPPQTVVMMPPPC